jgi:hypothetical protein
MCECDEGYSHEEPYTLEEIEAARVPGSAAVGWRIMQARATKQDAVAQAQIDSARYMKWSIIAVAVTSGLTAIAAIATAVMAYLAWGYPHR